MSDGGADDAAARAGSAEPGAAMVGDRPAARPWRAAVWIWLVAVAFAAVTWWPLVLNPRAGLQGGDIYTYFFPLKAWYAERLRAGELPLWNPLIGHGVPALAESQTGVFYPFNLLFYRVLSLGAAYNANFLLHYVLAFGFTCHYARRLGLPLSASFVTAVVFVYGWFPARSCLEWAIVTGAWIPLALWGVEGFLSGGRRLWLAATQCALLMQLLAGHFNLAFITLFVIGLYVPLRLFMDRRAPRDARRVLLQLAVALMLVAGTAAVQLIPSWELKGRSQRGSVEFGEQKIGYGGIPAGYLAQAVAPWRFYPHVRNDESEFVRRQFGANHTNKVEAHLYFGLVPMGLAAIGLIAAALGSFGVGRLPRVPVVCVWLVVGAANLALVTGWWTPWAVRLPGFGYFTGPGRYGVAVQIAIGVLAGYGVKALAEFTEGAYSPRPRLIWSAMLVTAAGVAFFVDRWTSWAGGLGGFGALVPLVQARVSTVMELGIATAVLFSLIMAIAWRRGTPFCPVATVAVLVSWVDLTLTSRFVQYAELRAASPIHAREQSIVGGLVRLERPDARVLARNQNAVSLCRVATVPPYLGIGPREYFEGPLAVPADFHWERTFSSETRRWLEWSGVTHVLAFEEMDDESLELVWSGHDPFLHDLLGRPPVEPLWLYRLRTARGRAYWVPAADAAGATDPRGATPSRVVPAELVRVSANRLEFAVECDIDAVVVVTDLTYPGWRGRVDDRLVDPVGESVFRAVRVGPGRHTIRWEYRPSSLLIAWVTSLMSVAGSVGFFWRNKK